MQKNDLVSIIIPCVNIKESLAVEKVSDHVHLKQIIAIYKNRWPKDFGKIALTILGKL